VRELATGRDLRPRLRDRLAVYAEGNGHAANRRRCVKRFGPHFTASVTAGGTQCFTSVPLNPSSLILLRTHGDGRREFLLQLSSHLLGASGSFSFNFTM
jgi:hypothetical protein